MSLLTVVKQRSQGMSSQFMVSTNKKCFANYSHTLHKYWILKTDCVALIKISTIRLERFWKSTKDDIADTCIRVVIDMRKSSLFRFVNLFGSSKIWIINNVSYFFKIWYTNLIIQRVKLWVSLSFSKYLKMKLVFMWMQ